MGSHGQVVHDAHGVPAFFYDLADQGSAQKAAATGNKPVHEFSYLFYPAIDQLLEVLEERG